MHSIGCIFMFLGKLFIVAGTAVLCYVMLTQWPAPRDAVSSPYFPCIVAGIIGYVVGSVFMTVYSFATDTILQCFFLDEELSEQGKRPVGSRPKELDAFISRANGGSGGCCCGCCC